MKHKVSELTGALLDAAVAKAEGLGRVEVASTLADPPSIKAVAYQGALYEPSTNWSQGGPIIERERIALYYEKDSRPSMRCVAGFDLSIDQGFGGSELTGADEPTIDLRHSSAGPTPLVAAMRAYLDRKFGEEVDL